MLECGCRLRNLKQPSSASPTPRATLMTLWPRHERRWHWCSCVACRATRISLKWCGEPGRSIRVGLFVPPRAYSDCVAVTANSNLCLLAGSSAVKTWVDLPTCDSTTQRAFTCRKAVAPLLEVGSV